MKKIIEFFKKIEAWIFRLFDKIADTAVGEWLGEGTRWAWLIFGFILGVFSDSFYCSSLVGGTAIIAYVASIGKEWKLKGSLLLCALIIVLALAGYGLADLLTEK